MPTWSSGKQRIAIPKHWPTLPVSRSARSCSGLNNGRGLSDGVADHKPQPHLKAYSRKRNQSGRVMKLLTVRSLAVMTLDLTVRLARFGPNQ